MKPDKQKPTYEQELELLEEILKVLEQIRDKP